MARFKRGNLVLDEAQKIIHGQNTVVSGDRKGLFSKIQLDLGAEVEEFSTDGTLYGNSDTAVPTEKAVKTYVDAAGGGISYITISSNTTAEEGKGYLINASNNDVTLTLPGSPSEGDTVAAVDAYDMATTNTITIGRNGENIEGDASDLIIDISGAGFTLVYCDSTRGWEIVSEIGMNVVDEGLFDYVKVSDVKAYNVYGGTFTSGAWRTRDINTEDSDDSGICSISNNQITLAAGTYICYVSCPAIAVDVNFIQLYNISDSEQVLLSMSGYSSNSYGGGLDAVLNGKFTIASQKVFEIQHYCQTTVADYGFGLGSGIAGIDAIYTIAEFWRVDT